MFSDDGVRVTVRSIRQLLSIGTTYAVFIRGAYSCSGLLPSLGDVGGGVHGHFVVLVLDLLLDLGLPAYALYWVLSGHRRHTGAAMQVFGSILLLDNAIYVGSTFWVPAKPIGAAIFMALVNAPLIAISLMIIAWDSTAAAMVSPRPAHTVYTAPHQYVPSEATAWPPRASVRHRQARRPAGQLRLTRRYVYDQPQGN